MATYTYGKMGEPPAGKIIQGTGHYSSPSAEGAEEEAYDAAYLAAGGTHQPLTKARDFNIGVNHGDYSYATLLGILNQVDAAGAIPNIGIAMRDFDNPDVETNAVDDVVANTTTYDSLIDLIASVIAGFNKPSYVRIGWEFNNSGGYHDHDYVKAYQKIWTAIRAKGGGGKKASFAWVWEPSGPADYFRFDEAGYFWWPGDDKIDWYGMDVFQKDPYFTPGTQTYNKMRDYMTTANARGFPVMLSEAEPGTLDIKSIADGGVGLDYWNFWFVPFFDWMDANPGAKMWNYINHDYGDGPGNLTGDHQLKTNTDLLALYSTKIAGAKYLDYTHQADLFPFETAYPPAGAGNPDGAQNATYRFDRKKFFGPDRPVPPRGYTPKPIPPLRVSRR